MKKKNNKKEECGQQRYKNWEDKKQKLVEYRQRYY